MGWKRWTEIKGQVKIMELNKKAVYAGLALGAAIGIPLAMLSPGRASAAKKAPFYGRNYAHRGLHTPDRIVPENSLAAFRRAADGGYGIELDVRLTRDGYVVVYHDDTLSRLCGVNKRVDELSYDELRALSLCGTMQTIPLFSEVLETIGGRVPLIVELKGGGKHRRELCQKTWALLRDYKGHACVESFDPLMVAWFRFHAPSLLRGQLASPRQDYLRGGKSAPVAFLLSRTLLNFISRPQFIAYRIGKRPLTVRCAEILGAMRVGWTSHDPTAEQGRDAVIFEFYRPKIRFK